MGAVVGLALAMAGCGGPGALGEECDSTGLTTDECEDGAICGKYKDDTEDLVCLQICNDHAQCNQAAGESCNGVDGSNIKGCRL